MLQTLHSPEAAIASHVTTHKDDEKWMKMALKAAQAAADQGEVPVGAIIVHDNTLIAAAGNSPIGQNDPTAHAEIRAIRIASRHLDNYRLPGSTLYVTLEPCIMCIGAIIHARIDRLVFGATDPKTGAVESIYQIGTDARLNHLPQITKGVLEKECSALLKNFFSAKRKQR